MEVKKKISIHIGEFYISAEPAIIYTLLGSCVAVCIYDPFQKSGGMNHILLPGQAAPDSLLDPTRYARNAIEILISGVTGLGGKPNNLIAKVFGGARLISSLPGDLCVGKALADFVLDFLYQEKIEIVSHDLGGSDVRKIYFHTDTGKVFLKRTTMQEQNRLIQKERMGIRRISCRSEQMGNPYPHLPNLPKC